MTDFNLNRMISKFVNYQALNANRVSQSAVNQHSQNSSPSPQNSAPSPQGTPYSAPANPQMGNLANVDRAIFVKDLMKLPKNLNEFVYMLQKNMSQAEFQSKFAALNAQRNSMSQTQAQILAQLQGLSLSEAQNLLLQGNKVLINQLQSAIKNLPLSSQGLINLNDISALIQANGKDAITKLITSMANAAKLGINDLSQLKDTARLINASIAAAAQNDSAQTMKLLLLLYLPWLPLQEGVGFDLEIETGEKDSESDSILVITISTINYGNVIATLILENSNSVHVTIECSEKFPKDELSLRIEGAEKHYSMQSVLSYETNNTKQNAISENEKPQAKINMSNTNQINPYMLLMAHTIIRHVIEIDKNTSAGITSHVDAY